MSFWVHLVLENSALEQVEPVENVCMVLDFVFLLVFFFFFLENWKKIQFACLILV